MNRKVTLDPETLTVESFAPVEATDATGTVNANQAQEFVEVQCNTRFTCSTRLC